MTVRREPAGRLRRFFVPPPALSSAGVSFPAPQSHHIATVLRLHPGARVVVFDGRHEAEAELVTVSDTATTARLTGAPREPARELDITLLQGIARGPRMDLVIRMGTEIGLTAIRPVVTARSLPDPGPARSARWERVAQEAARQCGRADVPAIAAPAPLAAALEALGPVDLLLVPWEEARTPIGGVIADVAWASAALLIGPEGGLTGDEVAAVRSAGAEPVSLGSHVLRTETAGAAAVAMLLYERTLRPPSS
jgi:16S rRNA (uracil1498-N3)-methyltransferase